MNQTTGFNVTFGGNNEERMASAAQIETYIKMCKQKGRAPKNVHGLTYASMSDLIQEMRDLPRPPSEGQYKMIMEMCERLGMHIGQETLKQLNITSASKLIEQLRAEEQKRREVLPATDNQVKLMLDMYLCPDVNYEFLDIPNRIDLGYDVTRPDGSTIRAWRLLTPDELQGYLIRVTQQNASDFINNYRDAFSAWRKTRLSQDQVTAIRNLERAMRNPNKPRVIEEAFTFEGDKIVLEPVKDVKREYNDTQSAYTPLEDHELLQLSYNDATHYIQRLRDELYNASKYKDTNDEVNPQVDDRDQHIQRSVKSMVWNDLNNVLHKLLAVAGIEDEELLECCLDTCDTGLSVTEIAKSEQYIRNFMKNCINRGEITVSGMFTLLESSEYAMEIFVGAKFPTK
jgi:hypothetical protein